MLHAEPLHLTNIFSGGEWLTMVDRLVHPGEPKSLELLRVEAAD